MSYSYPIPTTPRVISPSPTPSETSEQNESGYFTRSAARRTAKSPPPATIKEESKNDEDSDSSLEKRARARSRSPILTASGVVDVNGTIRSRRKLAGLTPGQQAQPVPTPRLTNGTVKNTLPPQENGHLSPYSQLKKSWREFSRSPSPLGLIPLHRHYRTLIHKHEIPRKALHVSIGFFTLWFYTAGRQKNDITPWLLGMLIPIGTVDILRHHYPTLNRIYVRSLGALMRESEVDGYNGTIWYLLGALISLHFFPKDISTISILLLSWCDTAASTFGRLYGRYTIRLRKGKSLAGSLAACLAGIATAALFWGVIVPYTGPLPNDPPEGNMFKGTLQCPARIRLLLGWSADQGIVSGSLALGLMSVVTGVIASLSEFVDVYNWDDNLTIPLFSSIGLWCFLKTFG